MDMDQEMRIKIGNAIAFGLQRKRMMQKDICKKYGYSSGQVSSWIAGRSTPPGDVLVKLIDELDLVSDLFPRYTKISNKNTEQLQIIDLEQRIRVLERLESIGRNRYILHELLDPTLDERE